MKTEDAILRAFKKEAKEIKRKTGCTHMEALDKVAQARTKFANWALLMRNYNKGQA